MSAGAETQGNERLLAGRYRLTSVLGRGGMGTVWRAWDEALHREVAVKEVVLHHSLGAEERAQRYERMLREARATARLNHPGVVTVHDVVDEDARPWIVMELVQSRSLQDLIDEGTLPPGRVAAIGRQVAGALKAAHAIGILHRDVKPANVLITSDDRAVLTDFGIAQIAGDATLTQAGIIMGSPAYMSPERVNGERALPASDLWALGATLYAAVEGQAPHQRSDAMAVLAAIMTLEPPQPRNAGPLAPVLMALLERDPARRLNAEAAERALTRVLEGEAALTVPDRVQVPQRSAQASTEALAPVEGTRPALAVPAPWDPPDATPPTGPVRPKGPRRFLWPVLAGALGVLVVALAVVLVRGLPSGDAGKGDTGQVVTGGSDGGESQTITEDSGGTWKTPPAVKPTLPPGMKWGVGDGYRVPVPAGWTMRRDSADRVYWLDPNSPAYIMVDRTGWTGDPVEHWDEWSTDPKTLKALKGFRRESLRSAQVQGEDAADVQFTWNNGGRLTRARDRGVIIDGQSYAVMVALPASQWNGQVKTVDNVLGGFHVSRR